MVPNYKKTFTCSDILINPFPAYLEHVVEAKSVTYGPLPLLPFDLVQTGMQFTWLFCTDE